MVAISLRLPEHLLADVKAEAAARGAKYQPLLRELIARGLQDLHLGTDTEPIDLEVTAEQLNRLLRLHGEVPLRLRTRPPRRERVRA
ncbi:MAG: CopG family antitoxin, partial [Candidatus Dormibacteraceae bacterium]